MGITKRVTGVLVGASVGLAFAGGVQAARGQCQAGELSKLVAIDGTSEDLFGLSVAAAGDPPGRIVIGAFQDDISGTYSGSAYLFRSEGLSWVQEDKLLAADGAAGDYFGRSVGISAGPPWRTLIGAYLDVHGGTSSGSAYVFKYDDVGLTWIEEGKLVPSDAVANQRFGGAVAIDGDLAVIGAWQDDDNGAGSGSAYVFRYDEISSSWIEEDKLLPADGAAGDQFGYSVDVSESPPGRIVVGAFQDDDNGSSSGSAYVFWYDDVTSSWIQEAKLLPSDGATWDTFGYAVAISAGPPWRTVIGAFQDDDNGVQSGSGYVFQYDGSTWGVQEEAKLLASDGAAGDNFGRSVSISGSPPGRIVLGALYDGDHGPYSGSAYVFGYDGLNWAQQAKLLAADGVQEDFFGVSVAVTDDMVVIGASGDDDNGADSGSAYVFGGLSDCNNNDTLDLCDIAEGTSRDCDPEGTPDECQIYGDLDRDGDVDLNDFATFAVCFTGSGAGPPTPGCECADLDVEGDVDLNDFATFALNFTG